MLNLLSETGSGFWQWGGHDIWRTQGFRHLLSVASRPRTGKRGSWSYSWLLGWCNFQIWCWRYTGGELSLCQLLVKILKGLFSKGTVVLHNYNWYNHCCCRWLRKVCVFVFQGFYLGDRIKVITKKDECPFVTEITISKVINRNNIYNLSCGQIVERKQLNVTALRNQKDDHITRRRVEFLNLAA